MTELGKGTFVSHTGLKRSRDISCMVILKPQILSQTSWRLPVIPATGVGWDEGGN